MRSSPIYQEKVNSERSNQSNGETRRQTTNTFVGSSASNSHHILGTVVERLFSDDKVIFNAYVDGKLVKKVIFHNNKGTAGEKMKTIEH